MSILFQTTAVPYSIQGNTLYVFFFGRRYSHNKLCLYNTKTHEKIERGADNLLQKYLLPLLIVEDIPEGEYLLYTSSEDGQESSKGYPVIFTGNKKADILSNMVSLWNLSDNLKTEIQEDMNQEEDVLFYLYRNYLKETDEDLLLARAKLLAAYLDFWNKRIKGYHLTPSDFLVDDENKTVTMDEDSEFLMQIDLKYLTIHIFPKTETNQIPVQEKTEIPYLYLEMDREHMPMNLFLSFTFRESIWSKIKTERNTRQENYQRAIEKQISYPSNIDFSEDKLPYLSIIDKLQPVVPFLHSPSLSYEHGIITVTSFEDDIPLLAEIQDRAYLAINEPEYCLDDNHRRFQADAAESFTIQNEFAGLGAEPYLYWWEDVYGTILSDIKLFDLSSAESPVALIQNQDSSFNEQMRQYNLYRYQQHLVPYLIGHSSEENKDKNYNLLQNSLAVAEEDTDCDSSSLARHILQWNCTSDNLYNFSSFASVMMQDFILYSRFRTDFFQQPFIYWDKQDTVVLPSGNEEILYKIEKYSISNGYTAEYMRAQQDTATEYRITNAEYAFVTAINTEEMRISGFLMIDFSRGLFAAELSRFMLPDVEVKHY